MENQACPVIRAPEITNPFQQLEDYMRLKGEDKSSSEEFGCPNPDSNPSLESFLPSSEISDLSPITDGYNDDSNIFFTQDDGIDMAVGNDIGPAPVFLAQNEFGSDDPINTNADYDGFLAQNGAADGVNGDEVSWITDQNLFDDNNADLNQIFRP